MTLQRLCKTDGPSTIVCVIWAYVQTCIILAQKFCHTGLQLTCHQGSLSTVASATSSAQVDREAGATLKTDTVPMEWNI